MGVHGVWGGLCEGGGKMLLWRCMRGAIPERCWGVLDDICCFGHLVKIWAFLVIEGVEISKTVSRIEIVPVNAKSSEPEKLDTSITEACDIEKC
ncbi:hypothetical protein [Bartonella sp. AP72JLCBS]|uniref:hypothetical protein n=2 Tax=Bartonella TaxID=773 RepID=UPI0035D12341